MSKKVEKVIALVRTDGLCNTVRNVWNKALFRLGLRISETYFFRMDLSSKELEMDFIRSRDLGNEINFGTVDGPGGVGKYEGLSKRLKFLPIEEWFAKRSKLFVAARQTEIVAYAWVHFNRHDIPLAGRLILHGNEAYVGPFFTGKKYRGFGLYYYVMSKVLKEIKNTGVEFVYGSSNSNNIPTIKVCIKTGFHLLGTARCKGFLKKGKRIVLDFSNTLSLRDKIEMI